MANVEKVVIYFPWREVSGGPIYLVRLAEELSKNSYYQVYYVDYDDGFSCKLISSSKIKRITVSETDFSIPLKEPVTIITPIYFACWLPPLHQKSKVLFVNWHVCCIPTLQHNWNISESNIRSFLKEVHRTRSVFFCDESHRLGQSKNYIEFERNIVPITLPAKNSLAKQDLINDEEINFVILGRLCRDKIFSVINVLDNLAPIKTEKTKIVHIIGDGPERELIDPCNYLDLQIKLIGELTQDELTDYLSINCDCLFAMGTSVLEGAILSLPSVIIPHNIQPLTCDKYVYLHNSNGYCLGWYDNQFDALKLNPVTMSDIVSDIIGKDGKSSMGRLSYNYYIENHTIEKAIVLFTNAIQNTTLTYKNVSDMSVRYAKVVKSIDFIKKDIITINRQPYGVDVMLFGRWKIFSARNSNDPVWKIIFFSGVDLFEVKKEGRGLSFRKARQDTVYDIKASLKKIKDEILDLRKINNRNIIDVNKRIDELNNNLILVDSRISERFDKLHYSNVVAIDTCDNLLNESSLSYFCGDIKEDYIKLTNGLDLKSIELVNRIINRIQKYRAESTCYFWVVKEEEEEFRSMMDFHSSRLSRLNDEYYSYGEFILPCNIITSTVFYYDCFMPELSFLDVYKGMDIIDAGGSFGDSALVLSKYTNKKVHVFEPTSFMCRMAEKTISENGLSDKVILNKIALGDKCETLNIKVAQDFSTLCFDSICAKNEDLETVEVIRLDDYVRDNNVNVGVLKVDVEGFEDKLLMGAMETIKSQRPALLFSIYHSAEHFFGIKSAIEDLNLGYKFKIRKPLDRSIIIDTILIAECDVDN